MVYEYASALYLKAFHFFFQCTVCVVEKDGLNHN